MVKMWKNDVIKRVILQQKEEEAEGFKRQLENTLFKNHNFCLILFFEIFNILTSNVQNWTNSEFFNKF